STPRFESLSARAGLLFAQNNLKPARSARCTTLNAVERRRFRAERATVIVPGEQFFKTCGGLPASLQRQAELLPPPRQAAVAPPMFLAGVDSATRHLQGIAV
ncbi:MAG TPA: hypothetical protein VIJ67_06305, partial [Pseudolabrys sp.]